MKLGYKASAEQFSPRQLLDFSLIAERVGFDSVFISDHYQPWRHSGGHSPFVGAWLGALGERSSRIVMGTSVLTPTFRYHPAVVAQMFGTLGAMYPGRIVLGIGTGESLNEVPPTGMAWPEQRERTLRLREALRLIRELWRNERVSFEGDFYRTANATIYDKPDQEIPIFVAAAGPLMARLAGEHSDGLICTSGKARDLYVETLLPNVADGEARAGRAAGSVERMIEMKVSFDLDARAALDNTRFWGALALSKEEKMSVEDPIEMERLADALPIEQVATRWIVSTDPQEHVDRIRAYIDMGFNHLVFHAPGADQERFLDLYSQHVMPRLRALA